MTTPSQPDLKAAAPGGMRFLDIDRGLDMVGDDEALRSLLRTVDDSLSVSLNDIRESLDRGDMVLANRQLHGIKGYAPIFCTEALVENVVRVEACSKTASADVLRPLFAELGPQLECLLQEIRIYVARN
jgi:HPt (histidine-containing phosphotransfer) domain-containing protein